MSILTANEQATAAQLRLMDPQLAGLYERGIRLMSQIHQPENVYLLAHCGRELSNGVLQLLLDEGGAPHLYSRKTSIVEGLPAPSMPSSRY